MEYQKYADIQHRPSVELSPYITPVPFARWGLDIIGPFSVVGGGRKFAFIAVKYFTKWAEAEPVKSINQDNAVKFVFRNIVYKFGVPIQIITDNGTQFTGKAMNFFCKDSNIKLSFASVHHPQSNGQVEAANKTIINILKRKTGDNPKSWADTIPEVLWAYRTMCKTATGQTPYTLAFGLEAVTPVELIWPTTRIKFYDAEKNEEAIMIEQENMEEIREEARIKEEKYKRKLENFYNAKVKSKDLRKGDLVLSNAQLTGLEQNRGKLSPNWEGPYVIKKVIREGTYILTDNNGKTLPRTYLACK